LLSASAGDNRQVLRECLRHKAQPIIGVALFSEYEDLFGRPEPLGKSHLSVEERREFFESFLSVCEWVRVYYLWRPNLPDEADNHLIELAIAGGANVIITSNTRDVARGELNFPDLRILTPKQFLQTI
jgi:predicted nucleic acid-binding protein